MGTIASLIAGAGLVTIWSAFWEPDPAPPRSKELHDRLRDRLNQAGMHDLSILGFSGVCMGLGLVSRVVALSLTTPLAIASALGILLGLSPTHRKSTRLNSSHVANSYGVLCVDNKQT